MALKSTNEQIASLEDVEEMLDAVDKNLERVKTLYEQYFLGIQKQAPSFLHTEIERKLRDLTQLQIRNTGLRYRFATIQQKFGAYNSYWKRTLRQIENGTYLRNLSKIGREAIRTGAAIPEEILAAMPKRMREQVVRDREAAIAIAKRRKPGVSEPPPDMLPPDPDELAAVISEPTALRRELKTRGGAYVLDEADAGMDLEAFFDEVESKPVPVPRAVSPVVPPKPASTNPAPPSPIDQAAIPRPIGPQPSRPIVKPPPIPLRGLPTNPASGTQPIARQPTGPYPVIPPPPTPTMPKVNIRTGEFPAVDPSSAPPSGNATRSGSAAIPTPLPAKAPSQATRANPIAPGAAAARGDVTAPSLSGPFPRAATPAGDKPAAKPADKPAAKDKPADKPPVPNRPPPGMTEADVNALYAKYIQAKQMVGEPTSPRERDKLLRTIHATAPKIMEQYKAKGVDFTVVVKDNQVIIRAKPKP